MNLMYGRGKQNTLAFPFQKEKCKIKKFGFFSVIFTVLFSFRHKFGKITFFLKFQLLCLPEVLV